MGWRESRSVIEKLTLYAYPGCSCRILLRNVVSVPSQFGRRAEMRYTIDMEQNDSEEEKAIQELESSRDDEDSEELWACSE